MRKPTYKTCAAVVLFGAALALSACHQPGGEPESVPPADAGAVSADSAVSDPGAATSETVADPN